MDTPFPDFDQSNPIFQRSLENFERKYLPELGLAGEHRKIKRAFLDCGVRPLICDLMEQVLAGEWGLGTTQWEVGEEIGLERSRISDAKCKGEMSLNTYISLQFAENRLRDLDPSQEVVNAMNLAGFMAVARFLAGFVRDRKGLIPAELDEPHHKLLCGIFRHYKQWACERMERRTALAAELVTQVCRSNAAHIVPDYYSDLQAAPGRTNAQQQTARATAAFKFLCRLQDDWEDIYVATANATEEGLGIRFVKRRPLANGSQRDGASRL